MIGALLYGLISSLFPTLTPVLNFFVGFAVVLNYGNKIRIQSKDNKDNLWNLFATILGFALMFLAFQ